NMNGSHTWVIQSGDSMYITGTAALDLSTSTLTVESGARFTNEKTSTNLTIGTFRILGGGIYYHRCNATAVPGNTKQFANSTNGGNGNGTVIVQISHSTAPLTGVYGHLTIECTNTNIWNMSGNLTDIEGDFT